MSRYAKLIMVTGSNNNKYYIMEESGTTINVKYGRVDSTEATASYPSSHWDKLLTSKVKKGYKDVTELITVCDDKEDDTALSVADTAEDIFIELMNSYTKNLVKNTYSVKATSVTSKQIKEAQDIINKLVSIGNTHIVNMAQANTLLLELYMTIPRYMGNVRNNILPHIDFNKTIEQEQDNLDAISSQIKSRPKSGTKSDKKVTSLQDQLGIKLKVIKTYPSISHITDQLRGRKIEGIYEVEKNVEDVVFNNWVNKSGNKETRLLIHGTRCTSVIPILEQGLKIRPMGNFQFSGKVYGDGNYFSEVTQKSLGYTGNDQDIILLVYEVHTGNPFKYEGWYRGNQFSLDYKELSKRGFDSTHVSAGNGLLNSEIITYKEEQSRIRFIIHLKR